MRCDLHNYFRGMADGLPIDENQKHSFTSQTFPNIPDHLTTEMVAIRKTHASYDDFRVDRLGFFAQRPTYQELGLLILSVVFRPGGKRVHLELTDPMSDIKHVIVEYGGKTKRSSGYRTRPEEFIFFPRKVDTHPFTRQQLQPFDLPRFRLTNLTELVVTEEDWVRRDTIIGFGNDDASVLLAELLLRIGSSLNDTNEIVLEGEGGFRGVGTHSAEAAFYLPGGFAWPALTT